ncbi:low molecular weight protein arginine phosphatase [Chloroflexota bacterium]
MRMVLCVCTGNVCRSPMAEGLLREKLDHEQIGVFSAGVWALDGQPATPNAVEVMAERGIDISSHIAHTITAEDVAEADLILVMTREHAKMICNSWTQYEWKVHLLSEMIGKRKDLVDPYGGPIEEYRICADTVSHYIDGGIRRILELT